MYCNYLIFQRGGEAVSAASIRIIMNFGIHPNNSATKRSRSRSIQRSTFPNRRPNLKINENRNKNVTNQIFNNHNTDRLLRQQCQIVNVRSRSKKIVSGVVVRNTRLTKIVVIVIIMVAVGLIGVGHHCRVGDEPRPRCLSVQLPGARCRICHPEH